MNQFFIGIILVLGMDSYYLYDQNITLQANNAALEGAVQTQQDAITAIQQNFELQSSSLASMTRRNAEIEADKAQYLAILSKHNFERLAIAKPGLMELRFNKGTQDVLQGIIDDTKNISSLESTSSND